MSSRLNQMMLENRYQPVISKRSFISRVARSFCVGLLILLFSLGIGMIGYHHFEKLNWLDAYTNAAMILSGMGPIINPTTIHGKLFAGTYALFSGLIFLLVMGIMFTPIIHRLFHKFHVEEGKKNE